jgi:hypothetical protein
MSIKLNKFDVEEREGRLHVLVEMPPYNYNYGIPKDHIRTGDVQRLLAERGVEYGACVKEAHVKNWREATRRGEWIFDIPAEPVIIEEEKYVKPKRTRRTRFSTTKVSTEE